MGNASFYSKKSQSLIETSFMLVAALLFFLGIFRIGLWYNNELAERQSAYQASRLAAGSSEIGKWPVYTRRPLTEDWVLKGENFPSPQQAGGGGIEAGRPRNTECEEPARAKEEQAKNNIKQAWILEDEAVRLDNEAARLEQEAAALQQQADYYQGLYDNCIASCDENYDYRQDCQQGCQPYLLEAQEYQRQADEKRRLADEKRRRAEQNRQEAARLKVEAEQLFDQALEIRKDCWK